MIDPIAQSLRDQILSSTALVRGELAKIDDAAKLLAAMVVVEDPPPASAVVSTVASSVSSAVVSTVASTIVAEPPNTDPVTFFKVPVDPSMQLCIDTWFKGWERYDRFIKRKVILAGETVTLNLRACNRTAGGIALNLPGFEYALLFGGVEVARCKPANTQNGAFKIVADALPDDMADGPYQYGLKQYDTNGNEVPLQGSFVPSFVYLNRKGKLKDAPWFPSYDGSFEVFRNNFEFHWAIIPRHYFFNDDGTWKLPNPAPLAKEDPPQEWTSMLPSSEFTCVQLNQYLKDDHYIMTRDRFGAPSFEGEHVYTINEQAFDAQCARMPVCDGPRGIGRIALALDGQPSRLGGAHVLDPSGVRRVDADGTITTLFGWRAIGWPALQWQEEAAIKAERVLVGDWSAVPVAKRGIDRSWTWVWDGRTIKQGSGAPIVNDGRTDGVMEPAHDIAPVMLVARPREGDLLEAHFATDSHKKPAVLRIGIDGLRSPWGVDITDDGIVLITEQSANCVSAYQRNLDGTYTKLWEVGGILNPQGIGHDGQGNVYVGSRVDFTIYRFNMTDRVVTAFKKAAITAKSWFMSVHVNRDPKTGGVYICAANNNEAANFGNPECWLPDGTKVNPFPWSSAPHGLKGGDSATYALPARTGWSVMVRGGSDIGLLKWRRKKATDIDFAAAGRWDSTGFHRQIDEDEAKWCGEGFHLVYGRHAIPSFRVDLPKGCADWADRHIAMNRWGE